MHSRRAALFVCRQCRTAATAAKAAPRECLAQPQAVAPNFSKWQRSTSLPPPVKRTSDDYYRDILSRRPPRTGAPSSQDRPGAKPSFAGHPNSNNFSGQQQSTNARRFGDHDEAPHLSRGRPANNDAVNRDSIQPNKWNNQQQSRGPAIANRPLFSPPALEDDGHNTNRKRSLRGADQSSQKQKGSIVSRLIRGQETFSKNTKQHLGQLKPAPQKPRQIKPLKPVTTDVYIPSLITVEGLAHILNVRLDNLQRCMRRSGMEDKTSNDFMLSSDFASLLAMEYNRNPVIDDEAAFDIYRPAVHPDPQSLPRRPPIVTIMGHVDHGKTTLLDTLRSTSVAKGEAGGITQHIGAFSVPVPGGPDSPQFITFLDTPGHAAFSAMRARGAQVTDIVVLVVAADDGVKPQTKEVIDLVMKDDKLSVVVAINKVDKPGADVDKVCRQLWEHGVQLERDGGDIPSVEVSGLTGVGLDQLMETISAVAEMQDIRGETAGNIQGYVLESKVHKGLGPSASVLLLRGSLHQSSHLICGTTFAKVRQMTDSTGKPLKVAHPGMAVTVSGWKDLPEVGDEVLQGTENEVKSAVQNRIRRGQLLATLAEAEAINETKRLGREKRSAEEQQEGQEDVSQQTNLNVEQPAGPKELRLLVKGDVSGSNEALTAALEAIGNQHAVTKVTSSGVGDVTESDVALAGTIGGVIVAFAVQAPKAAKALAAQNSVPIYQSAIIYEVMDEVKRRIIGLLPTTKETRVIGEANIQEMFEIQLKGRKTLAVAGCRVINGVIEKSRLARVIRNGQTVHEGPLNTLRTFKTDITEAKKGVECGMSFEGFTDLRSGDLIQTYEEIVKPGKL